MQPLITRNDIAKYRQISKTSKDDKLNEMILDAQLLDIQPLLGENLFNSILTSPEDFTELLDGGIYENDGISYTNYGLKMVICYFAYARYMLFSSAIDTPFSVVQKISSNDSKPAENSVKKTIYSLNREAAFQIWSNVKNYLKRTKNPEFVHCNTSMGNLRFTKLS
jgi:hypothetical protein